MTLYRWKMMACSLGLSLGGLAMCSGQQNDKDKPAPPAAAPIAPLPIDVTPLSPPSIKPPAIEIPPPMTVAPPISIPDPPKRHESELKNPSSIDLPPIIQADPVAPATATAPKIEIPLTDKSSSAPLIQVEAPVPPAVAPAAPPEREKLPTPKTAAPALDVLVPVAPPSTAKAKSEPIIPLTPVAPATKQGSPLAPVAPQPLIKSDLIAPATPATLQPSPAPVAPSTNAPVTPSKLKMLVRLGDGKPRFEIRNTGAEDVLLKVYGEKIEMQSAPEGVKNSPIAGVTAIGKVRFIGPGIEGTCDNLSVLSGTGEVLMKGNVHLKTKRGKSWSEMTTEKMIYQIGASGLTTPVNKATSKEQGDS